MVLYCGFLYIHFLANFAVACWITWKINHVTNTDIRVACYNAVKDPQAKDQCKNLVGDTGKLLLIIVWVIIVIELCKCFHNVALRRTLTKVVSRRRPHCYSLYTPAPQGEETRSPELHAHRQRRLWRMEQRKQDRQS